MQVGIVGLANSGKTTIFNALTRGRTETPGFSLGTFEVHTAVINVPDERLERLGEMYYPRKKVYAQVQYNDIAGLARGMGEAGGISGPLLNQISQNDALLHVVRAFEDPNVPHPGGSVDPRRDVETLEQEFLLSDLVIVEHRLERLQEMKGKGGTQAEREANARELAVVERLHAALEQETPLRMVKDLAEEEEKLIRGFGLLTRKPVLILLNGDDEMDESVLDELGELPPGTQAMALRGRLEMELAQMEADEAAEFLADFGIEEPALRRVIQQCYELMGLQSFFTIGDDEVRAWTISQCATALEAAEIIHTDLARGFIRAEVFGHNDLMRLGSESEIKKAGLLRLEGKNYYVQDGDIIKVRFSV